MIAHAKAAKVAKGGLVIWDWLFGIGYWFVALLRPACAVLRRAPATGGWEWISRIRGTRHRGCGTRFRALSRALFMVGSQEEEIMIKKNGLVLRMSAVGE